MKRAGGIETEEKIIQAALELFVRKGYHGTSITDIMNKVGLSKGSLYAHFKSKGELLLRIIDGYKVRYLDEMTRLAKDGEGDALDKLHQCISFSARFAAEHQSLCGFLICITTELKADIEFEPVLKAVNHHYQRLFSGIIRQGITQGVVDKGTDPGMAALTFMALHGGMLHQWALNRNMIDAGEYVRTFRKTFIYGLASDKGRNMCDERTWRSR